ncbi:9-O-acetylesterase [Bacteroidia bacterium]|nr:9-O-acetylesterase [Bacteroidia bacterium]
MRTHTLFSRTAWTIVVLFFVINVSAKIELPTILSDNLVLQQQTAVKLWGKARKSAKINVQTSWDNHNYQTTTDSNGNWLLTVNTPKAGGPYSIDISDGEKLTLNNVLIGEVWFCSGQSNMEMPMRGFDRQPVQGSNDIIAKAKPSTPIRLYTTDSDNGVWDRQFSKTPQTNCRGHWAENSPENVANISAVGYYFARYIQEVLEVPVGIIVSSWGGSRVEPWISQEAFAEFPDTDLSILSSNDEVKNPTATPCVLYNAKIAPLTSFTIKGFLWYQGESNQDNPERYRQLMKVFVKDLRQRWNIGDFPFYFVEIAPYNYGDPNGTWAARLREAQQQNMQDIPHSGMVTTLDIGNPVFIHPVDKETVGNRLAYWALAKDYGKKGFGYATPVYQSQEIVENKIYINVANVPEGLAPMWTDLKGFEIAGEDRIFHPAHAEIEESTCRLAVSSEEVSAPIAVRYAYKNYAEASIFNVYGIPLAPFRTDNW